MEFIEIKQLTKSKCFKKLEKATQPKEFKERKKYKESKKMREAQEVKAILECASVDVSVA